MPIPTGSVGFSCLPLGCYEYSDVHPPEPRRARPVLMALRAMPEVGAEVVVDFLGATVAGTVRSVEPGGRGLEVETESGERLRFRLNRATAIFTADGLQTGARLRFTSR